MEDNFILRFIICIIVIPIAYALISLNLMNSDSVRQLTYGIIIGLLSYIAFKKS
jgi:hypothetical protein